MEQRRLVHDQITCLFVDIFVEGGDMGGAGVKPRRARIRLVTCTEPHRTVLNRGIPVFVDLKRI